MSNWDERFGGEPNDTKGEEQCVRMKDGKFNDALCRLDRTGGKKWGIGMGYICENHNYYESACDNPAKKSSYKGSIFLFRILFGNSDNLTLFELQAKFGVKLQL